MATAVKRRRFDPDRDARRFVKLTDGESLFECVAVRGVLPGDRRAGRMPREDAALKLLDCSRDWPDDPFDALDAGVWVALAVVERFEVVELAT